jgi:O-antigen ligase
MAPYALRGEVPPDIVHSTVGQIGAECGWPGLVAALSVCVRFTWLAWRRSREPGPAQSLHQGLLLAYLALFITGFMESVMWVEPCNLAVLTWAAIGSQDPSGLPQLDSDGHEKG